MGDMFSKELSKQYAKDQCPTTANPDLRHSTFDKDIKSLTPHGMGWCPPQEFRSIASQEQLDNVITKFGSAMVDCFEKGLDYHSIGGFNKLLKVVAQRTELTPCAVLELMMYNEFPMPDGARVSMNDEYDHNLDSVMAEFEMTPCEEDRHVQRYINVMTNAQGFRADELVRTGKQPQLYPTIQSKAVGQRAIHMDDNNWCQIVALYKTYEADFTQPKCRTDGMLAIRIACLNNTAASIHEAKDRAAYTTNNEDSSVLMECGVYSMEAHFRCVTSRDTNT